MKNLLVVCLVFSITGIFAADFTGNELLGVLGKNTATPYYKEYSEFWLLNSRMGNPAGGLKLWANSNGTVDTIIVAGNNAIVNGILYRACSSPLPYGISINDYPMVISQKINAAAFQNGNYVSYIWSGYGMLLKQNNDGKIQWLKFYTAPAQASLITQAPIKPMQVTETSPTTAAIEKNNTLHTGDKKMVLDNNGVAFSANDRTGATSEHLNKLESAKMAIENSTFNSNTPIAKANTKPVTAGIKEADKTTIIAASPGIRPNTTTVKTTTTTISASPMKKAIMTVVQSWRESGFNSIKDAQKPIANFWNYRYTYSTHVNIPGEKYNMVYCFPFPYSQMDFVSVLHEGAYDSQFVAVYKDIEHKLTTSLPASEGWVASCLPNTDGSKLSDLEFKNDKYGSVILDYSRSPNGRSVLYLRFLLFSN